MAYRVPYTSGNLKGVQWGTDDVFAGVANSTNIFIGDAGKNIVDHARGGDDSFTGGDNATNIFYGDAFKDISKSARGGEDLF